MLTQSLEVLATGARLVVISFHTLEDRMVKRFMNEQAKGDDYPAGVPVQFADLNPRVKKVGKMIKASADEVRINPRARSAVMRVAQKLA